MRIYNIFIIYFKPKMHLFATSIDTFDRFDIDLYRCPVEESQFNYQNRELATISVLASMTGTAGQLRFHLGAAMNTGLTETQIKDFIAALKSKGVKNEADNAYEILDKVLSISMQNGYEASR